MEKAFDFRCPKADLQVRVLTAAVSPAEVAQGIRLTCVACGQLHIVVPATGACVLTLPERFVSGAGRC